MTKLPAKPNEVDPPSTLRLNLIKMRDDALMRADFAATVLLSHALAWLHWTQEVLDLKTDDVDLDVPPDTDRLHVAMSMLAPKGEPEKLKLLHRVIFGWSSERFFGALDKLIETGKIKLTHDPRNPRS
jgi:hypothetical protein